MKNKLIKMRQAEVAEYEFNIRNYYLMIEKIGNDEELQSFKKELKELIKATTPQLKKANIILQATIENELDMIDIDSTD